MGKLIYGTIASLDGYVSDRDGNFDWAEPDAEVHGFVNDLERPIGTYLYGRRMYDVMLAWETMQSDEPLLLDYAGVWKAAEKVVYSRTLATAASARTRIEREFEPASVRTIKAEAQTDISIGGPELAGQALKAGLVDECQLFVVPAIVGGGTRWLPDDLRLDLTLLEERRFRSSVIYLRYGVAI